MVLGGEFLDAVRQLFAQREEILRIPREPADIHHHAAGGLGTFSVDLPPGFYDVFAAAPAFTPVCRKVRIVTGEATRIAFRMNADPLYTAEMGSRIETIPPKQ
jgi:hypothetical protein